MDSAEIDTSPTPVERTTPIRITLSLTWETVLTSLLFAAALVTRLWDLGARVMSHDESLHVYYSWLLSIGNPYQHNPMMHGPSLFELTALVNRLFGASDFTSRLVPALLGTFVVIGVPQLLKPWIGRAGALAASALLLISPYMLFFSRYIRHDMIVIAWMLLALYAILQYLDARQEIDSPDSPAGTKTAQQSERALFLLAAALALMISTMEITFFYLAIFVGYLVLRMLSRYGRDLPGIRQSPEFDLVILLATLGAFFSSPIALLFLNPVWRRLTGVDFVNVKVLDSQTLAWLTTVDGTRLIILLAIFSAAAILVGLWWGRLRWLKLAAVFALVSMALFTTFGAYPKGVYSGLIGSLGYWLSQQAVARGTQPWYFYLIVMPPYEYLPMIGSVLAGVTFATRWRSLASRTRTLISYLVWWGVLIFTALTIAGEKMPWLSVHITLPLILLTGWWIGTLVERIWQARTSGLSLRQFRLPALALGLMALLAFATARTAYMASFVNYDYSTEYLDYAHGAPGVHWVMDDLQEIGRRAGEGKALKVAFDNEVSWPMLWYLRDYPNQVYFGDQPNRDALNAPVVLAGPQNWNKVEAILGSEYRRYDVIRMWWPLEDYKDLTWDRIRHAITDPQMRLALWDILWKRDYRAYAAAAGEDLTPPRNWPLAEHMRIYLRKDLAEPADSLKITPYRMVDLPSPVDAYAAVRIKPSPLQVIGGGELSLPRGIAVAADGSLYVADTSNNRVVKFDPSGTVSATWGLKSPGDQPEPPAGTFNEPWGIAVDASGNVYVADTWNHRVQKFDSNGNFLAAWGTPGTSAEGAGNFWGPRGIVVSPAGRVYVTDTGNKRVAVFDENGSFLFDFGAQGPGALDEPVGVSIGPGGDVYVADTWHRQVSIFTATGEYLRSWTYTGWQSVSLDNKPFLAVDSQDRVYLTDPEAFQVTVFSQNGTPIASFGQFGPEAESFNLPTGIALDEQGNIYIADVGNNRLVKYPSLP